MEKPGRLSGQLTGRSPYLQPVQVMAPKELIGTMVPVTITDVGTNSLFGVLADAPRIEAESRVVQSLAALGA
jgi:tRNA-2-methylthio-N6-dimethylallyladenosine synthase